MNYFIIGKNEKKKIGTTICLTLEHKAYSRETEKMKGEVSKWCFDLFVIIEVVLFWNGKVFKLFLCVEGKGKKVVIVWSGLPPLF